MQLARISLDAACQDHKLHDAPISLPPTLLVKPVLDQHMHAAGMMPPSRYEAYVSVASLVGLGYCCQSQCQMVCPYLWQQVAEQLLQLDFGSGSLAPPKLNMPVIWEHKVPSALLPWNHAQHVLYTTSRPHNSHETFNKQVLS